MLVSKIEAPLKVILQDLTMEPQYHISGNRDSRILQCHYLDKPNLGFPIPEKYKSNYETTSKKRAKRHAKQIENWMSFFKKIGGEEKPINFKKYEKSVKNLIRNHGIPSKYRSKVWLECLCVHKKLDWNRGYYEKMLDADITIPNEISRQIEMDLCRTFPRHPYFKYNPEKTPLGLSQLRNVLRAFAKRNPFIAYCQSQNFIAGYLLLHFDEEEAFWMFVKIVEEILPADYYNPQMRGIRVDVKVLEHLIEFYLPTLSDYSKKVGIEYGSILTAWFLHLFVETFPVHTTLRIWDLLFNEGSKILFRVALAMLQINSATILKCKSQGELMELLKKAGKQQVDDEQLIKTCFKFHKLKNDTISTKREYYAAIIDEEQQLYDARRASHKLQLEHRHAVRKYLKETNDALKESSSLLEQHELWLENAIVA